MTDDSLVDRLRHTLEGRDILVTGHTGFKGAWLTVLLRHLGARVHGYALDPEPGALFTSLDLGTQCATDTRATITDLAAVRAVLAASGADLVMHLAAESLVRRSYRQPLATFATNIMGTATVLEAMRLDRPDVAAVVVTSDKVYQNDGRTTTYGHSDALGGRDPYSASKAAAEGIVDSYRQSFGLRVATVRAGNVIGGGDVCEDRLLPDATRAWRQGQPLQVRSPDSTRPWQHVLDPLLAYLEIGAGLCTGRSTLERGWNVGPSEAAWTVAQVLDEATTHWPGAQWLPSPTPDAPTEAQRLDLDTSDTLQHLAWRPAWPTQRAVARTIQWSQRRANGADPAVLVAQDVQAFLARQPA